MPSEFLLALFRLISSPNDRRRTDLPSTPQVTHACVMLWGSSGSPPGNRQERNLAEPRVRAKGWRLVRDSPTSPLPPPHPCFRRWLPSKPGPGRSSGEQPTGGAFFQSLSFTLLSLPRLSGDRVRVWCQACGPCLSLRYPWDTAACGHTG